MSRKRKVEETVIMVTGGTGLVGMGIRAVVERQKVPNERWVYLSSKDGDLRNREQVKALYDKHKPKYVIHLAAKVGGLFANMKYRVEFYRENILINDNVLDCAMEAGVERVTRASRRASSPTRPPTPSTRR